MTAVETFIAAVETAMRAELARAPVAAPALRLLDAGGKRLRARLMWWSANAAGLRPCSPDDPMLIRAATAVEFAHLGSLIHDDIVDGGDTRRGVSTLHREYGVGIATEAGAALAHLANELVATLGHPARRAVRRALLATCRGQIRELTIPFVMVSPRARLAIMQEKTGAFFELAAALGALIGAAERKAGAAVRRYARRFGVAFQIADDVLDLAGDPRELGRANGADLRDGVMTLPVLLANDPAGILRRALNRLQSAPQPAAIAACAAAITDGGGVATAAAVATWWLGRALDALRPLPETPAVAELASLARASVERGLRPATASFGGDASSMAPVADPQPASLIERPAANGPRSVTILDPRLASILEWFHPGLAAMVTVRAQAPAVRAQRAFFKRFLQRGGSWGPEANVAADAVALAHAMADEESLRVDPVRTLALVDALHCAAIGFLSSAPSASEHERLAAGARTLRRERPSIGGPAQFAYAQESVALSPA